MNADAPIAPAAVTPFFGVALHLGFSDPRSALRVPLPLPPTLRIALVTQLGARGGAVVDAAQGLSSFHANAVQGVQAAIEILVNGTALLVDEAAPLALRVVLVGVTDASDDARGAALTRAYRVLPLTRDQTLLLTRDLYERLDPALSERTRLAASPACLDDHPELADLFDLDWKAAALRLPEVTFIPEPQAAGPVRDCLELSHGGTQLNLTAKDCPLTVGRDKTCGLHLDGDVASRVHGRIEFVHDKFYFVDDSRNGTYLLNPQGEEVFLHRERLPLLGRGVISPGAPVVKQTGEVLRYRCRGDDAAGELMASLVPPAIAAAPQAADADPQPAI